METLTSELLGLLGLASEDPQVEAFLSRMRIYERPKTVAQLEKDGFIDPNDDDADIDQVCPHLPHVRLGYVQIGRRRTQESHQIWRGDSAPTNRFPKRYRRLPDSWKSDCRPIDERLVKYSTTATLAAGARGGA